MFRLQPCHDTTSARTSQRHLRVYLQGLLRKPRCDRRSIKVEIKSGSCRCLPSSRHRLRRHTGEAMEPTPVIMDAGMRASDAPSSGFIRYENVDTQYLERRSLKKSAGWVWLWALGVG